MEPFDSPVSVAIFIFGNAPPTVSVTAAKRYIFYQDTGIVLDAGEMQMGNHNWKLEVDLDLAFRERTPFSDFVAEITSSGGTLSTKHAVIKGASAIGDPSPVPAKARVTAYFAKGPMRFQVSKTKSNNDLQLQLTDVIKSNNYSLKLNLRKCQCQIYLSL